MRSEWPGEGVLAGQKGVMRVYRIPDIALETVCDVIRSPGALLKLSSKATTHRVGDYVVKTSSRAHPLKMALKLTVFRSRYRRAWLASRHLEARGIRVARPFAFVEWGGSGLIVGNAFICEYLDGYMDVEHYADRMIAGGWAQDDIREYLSALAGAVNALSASGAYHTDLAGKNILTCNGREFAFIDLDSILLNTPYTRSRRFKNHVQLYDSFIDRWGDELLQPFLAQMLPGEGPSARWMNAVRRAQAARRARTEALWRKQGRLRDRVG